MASTYKRKPHAFNARLSARRDELIDAVVTCDQSGRIVIAMFPAMTFPSVVVAERFLLRIIKSSRQEQGAK